MPVTLQELQNVIKACLQFLNIFTMSIKLSKLFKANSIQYFNDLVDYTKQVFLNALFFQVNF